MDEVAAKLMLERDAPPPSVVVAPPVWRLPVRVVCDHCAGTGTLDAGKAHLERVCATCAGQGGMTRQIELDAPALRALSEMLYAIRPRPRLNKG